MHCHTHEYSVEELEEIISRLKGNIKIVSVSEDVESLRKTMEYYSIYPEHIIPCAGLHPWNIPEGGLLQAEELVREAQRHGLKCIGEVGLDRRFVDIRTWEVQTQIFKMFLHAARELDAYVTIHSPNAWKQALLLLVETGVEKAMFHWYTGPVNLIPEIVGSGYYVSINPALKIQEKHRRIAVASPLEGIVFESDGPYNYSGLRLSPLMIPEAVSIVAELKNVPEELVWENAARNSRRLLGI
jgi:TatD DNase family protein